ncbi:MoxR family ATPase [Deltaproteobacteria bacterium TL4]
MTSSRAFSGTSTYLLDEKLSEAFHIARLLGKPLLLEGEPGTGKTKLAQEYAYSENLPIFEVPITSESKVSNLVSRFDEVQRLMDAQAIIANAQMKQAKIDMIISTGDRKVDHLEDYVHLGPLAKAYNTPHSVLLLDEIDKAPRELPNNLLFLLSERRIVIPETQQVIECTPESMPTIVITSNHEQDLPAPFVRRCIYAYIEFPSPERMRDIIRLHHPNANDKMVQTAIEIFYQLRDLDLTRKPSTAEILDWITYLIRENIYDAKSIQRIQGAQTLVKHRDDRELLEIIQKEGISAAKRQQTSKTYW